MPLQLRIAVVVTAAVIAAATQRHYLASRLETESFVGFRRAVEVRRPVSLEDLQPVELSDPWLLSNLLVPWEERATLIERPALRTYQAGELVVRRDFEQTVTEAVVKRPGEYLFQIDLPPAANVKTGFQIGASVGFLIAKKADSQATAGNIVSCGPFVLRALGPITKQLDPRILQSVSTRTVTLAVPEQPGQAMPDRARQLLESANQQNGSSIIGLYYPSEAAGQAAG